MKNFNNEQIEFIKENYGDEVREQVDYAVDSALIYYSDIEDYVRQFSNITDVLRGDYTMDNLYEDVYNDIYENEFDDIAEEIYINLDSEEQQEIDDLDDKENG